MILKQYIFKCCADIVKHIIRFAQRGEWTRAWSELNLAVWGTGRHIENPIQPCTSTLRFQFGWSIYLSIVASLSKFVLRRDNSCYGGQESLWSWICNVKPKYISFILFFMNGGSVYGKWICGPEFLLAFAAWHQHPFQVICLNMLSHIPFVHCLLSTYFTFIGCFPLEFVQ